MNRYDVAIIGGGPIGGFVANNIGSKGYNVAIFEEHEEIGTPLKCAGLITERVFEFINLPKSKLIENEIFGANIYTPSDKKITIGGDKKHAIAINRPIFDQEIMKKAENTGAKIFLGAKAFSAKHKDNHVTLNIKQNKKQIQIKSSLLIGADGPYSKIRNVFDFPKPMEYIKGIGAKAENTNLDPKFVKIFLGRKIAPGFFAWIIPTNKTGTEARIGLCIDKTSKYTLKQCFNKLLEKKILKDVKITKTIAGTIPLGPLKKTTKDNVILVGDAAAQVKPTSGGGIYPGIVCGAHCSNASIDALETNIFKNKNLKKYHKEWTGEIGRELMFGMKFRKIFKKLDDKKIDKYLDKLNTSKNIEIISKYGDIDYPSKLIFPIIKKNPSFLKIIPSALKKL